MHAGFLGQNRFLSSLFLQYLLSLFQFLLYFQNMRKPISVDEVSLWCLNLPTFENNLLVKIKHCFVDWFKTILRIKVWCINTLKDIKYFAFIVVFPCRKYFSELVNICHSLRFYKSENYNFFTTLYFAFQKTNLKFIESISLILQPKNIVEVRNIVWCTKNSNITFKILDKN